MEKDMLILMDDGKHHAPTRRNIIDAFTRITQYSEPGDIVFVHYSGHGGRVTDTSGKCSNGCRDQKSQWLCIYAVYLCTSAAYAELKKHCI